jgi:hypothetical protein
VVEYELALAIALEIKGACSDQFAGLPNREVLGAPTSTWPDAAGVLERGQPSPFEKRGFLPHESIPIGLVHILRKMGENPDFKVLF